jgi:hypothetical protein
MRDLVSNIKSSVALNAAAIASNTTTNGVVIDTKGFDQLAFVIQSGVLTDGSYAVKLQHGDVANGSDMVDAGVDNQQPSAGVTFAATDDNVVKKLGYRGQTALKRYVRVVITSTGVTTGGTLAAQALQGRAGSYPIA